MYYEAEEKCGMRAISCPLQGQLGEGFGDGTLVIAMYARYMIISSAVRAEV